MYLKSYKNFIKNQLWIPQEDHWFRQRRTMESPPHAGPGPGKLAQDTNHPHLQIHGDVHRQILSEMLILHCPHRFRKGRFQLRGKGLPHLHRLGHGLRYRIHPQSHNHPSRKQHLVGCRRYYGLLQCVV